jgi:predicted ATPase
MLHELTFLEDWRCFKSGETFNFRPGVNLLVGDQGTGKSSLIQSIAAASKVKKYKYEHGLEKKIKIVAERTNFGGFDFEKDNLRTQSYFGDNMQLQLASMFSSHGQFNLSLLKSLTVAASCVLCLDEPDMALSVKSICTLIRFCKGAVTRDCQIIAAVHNPILITAFEEVYSMDERCWVKSFKYVGDQMDGN